MQIKNLKNLNKKNKESLNKNYNGCKGQIWIETVIYVLIGLTVIAIILSIATPQIQKMRERAILKQTINALNELDGEVKKIEQAPGNIKIIEFRIARGRLDINPVEDKITYVLENTNLEFSESGEEIKEGELTLKTEKVGRRFNVFLELRYRDKLNLLYKKGNEVKTLHGSALYKIKIENLGNGIDETGSEKPTKIDFSVE